MRLNFLRGWMLTFLVVFVTPAISQEQEPQETLVWNRAPLRIVLPVSSERQIDFPAEVDVYLLESLANTLHVTATPEGSTFWTASDKFGTERMMVTDKSGQMQWLVDVSAEPNAPTHRLTIRDSRFTAKAETLAGIESAEQAPSKIPGATGVVLDEVDVVRAVARQFYGPTRLAEMPAGISRVGAKTGEVSIYRGAPLTTEVLGAWRAMSDGSDLYVTAIKVSNRASYEIRPDPRRISVRIRAMAAQHSWLAPAGNAPHDSTLWYLVSDRPLQETTP